MEKMKGYSFSFFGVVLSAMFPVLFLFFQNANEAGFGEVVPVLAAYIVISVLLFLLCCALFRSPEKSAVVVIVLFQALANFSLIEKMLKLLFPKMHYWHTVPVILVIVFHIVWLILRFVKREFLPDIVKVICIVFTGLTLLNGIFAVPKITARLDAKRQITAFNASGKEENVLEAAGKPNIYLIIFDEYANFTQMEKYYDFDNVELREYLEQNNFNISYTSHNDSIYTATVLTNLMNLNYVTDDKMLASERERIRKNGELPFLMRNNGYNFQIIEAENFLSDESTHAGTDKNSENTTTMEGKTITDLLIGQSIIYPFCSNSEEDTLKDILAVADYLASDAAIPTSDTFTIGYLNFPHPPYLVDKDGNRLNIQVNSNNIQECYFGQFQYATKLMIAILDNIIENDPSAVVILQSDHGFRANVKTLSSSIFPLEVMTNNLSAVYFRGKRLDIEGLSSVNTVRAVLNDLLDLDLAMLEVPVFTGLE